MQQGPLKWAKLPHPPPRDSSEKQHSGGEPRVQWHRTISHRT